MAYAYAIVITKLVNVVFLCTQLNVSVTEIFLTKPKIPMSIPTLLQDYVTESCQSGKRKQ